MISLKFCKMINSFKLCVLTGSGDLSQFLQIEVSKIVTITFFPIYEIWVSPVVYFLYIFFYGSVIVWN